MSNAPPERGVVLSFGFRFSVRLFPLLFVVVLFPVIQESFDLERRSLSKIILFLDNIRNPREADDHGVNENQKLLLEMISL